MADDMLCMHCLEEGTWTDEDCCPKCREKGHVSPWSVSKCPACNQEFFDKIKEIKDRIDRRSNFNHCLAQLQQELHDMRQEIAKLKEQLAGHQKSLEGLHQTVIPIMRIG